MSKESNKRVLGMNVGVSLMTLVCFVIYTFLVKTMNVRAVGEYSSVVGFADLNESFYKMLPYNELFYKLSSVFGILVFAIAGFFGVCGLMQLIKNKSLAKVDFRLYALAGLYVVTGIVYILFEKVIINYRPVIVDVEEGLEASYPSSHTVLAMVICLSGYVMYQAVLDNKKLVLILKIASLVLMAAVIITRVLAGVHWITDIVGGLLLSTTLFSFFVTVINILASSKKSNI